MKWAAAAAAVLTLLTSCSAEEMAWWQSRVTEAEAAGAACPNVAPGLEIAGLPDHFDVVIHRESNCLPWAVNSSSGALGLTQIMPFWLSVLCPLGIACTEAELLDGQRNLLAARIVFDAQGWSAWSQTA